MSRWFDSCREGFSNGLQCRNVRGRVLGVGLGVAAISLPVITYGGAGRVPSKPFTVQYQVEQTVFLNETARKNLLENKRQQYDALVKEGRLTRELADRQLESLNRNRSKESKGKALVTLSSDGTWVLVRIQRSNDPAGTVILTDGKRLYQYNKDGGRQLQVSDGDNIYRGTLGGVPVLPFDYACVQLTRSVEPMAGNGKYPVASVVNSDGVLLKYEDGACSFDPQTKKPIVIDVPFPGTDQTMSKWEYSKYGSAKAALVPASVVYSGYAPIGRTPKEGFYLQMQNRFLETSYQDKALPADEFTIEKYIPDNTFVMDWRTTQDLVFSYQRKLGTVESQLKLARPRDEDEAAGGLSKSKTPYVVVSILTLVCAIAIFLKLKNRR